MSPKSVLGSPNQVPVMWRWGGRVRGGLHFRTAFPRPLRSEAEDRPRQVEPFLMSPHHLDEARLGPQTSADGDPSVEAEGASMPP